VIRELPNLSAARDGRDVPLVALAVAIRRLSMPSDPADCQSFGLR
jgi:hypothetical protein